MDSSRSDTTGSSRRSKRVSLAPLTTEEALRGLLAAGPHPKDDKPAAGTEAAPPKRRRKANKHRAATSNG
jgi:hypothetical protein